MKIVISSNQRSKNVPDIEELLAKVRVLTNEGVDPKKAKSITELIKIRLQLSVLKILGIDIPNEDDEKKEEKEEKTKTYKVGLDFFE